MMSMWLILKQRLTKFVKVCYFRDGHTGVICKTLGIVHIMWIIEVLFVEEVLFGNLLPQLGVSHLLEDMVCEDRNE